MELRPHQVDAIDGLRDGIRRGLKRQVLSAPTGFGKCHPAGTSIIMHDGSVRAVEQISAGDALMGPDSRARLVTATGVGRGEIFQITPLSFGDAFCCNLDHRLSLVRTEDGTNKAGDIVDVSLAEWFDWSPWMRHIHKLWRVGVNFPEAEAASLSLPIGAYGLGLLLGDGSICAGSPKICTTEDGILDGVHELAREMGTAVRPSISENRAPSYLLTTRRGESNPLIDALRDYGLWGRSAYTKFVPEIYKRAESHDRLALLAGLVDTDGYLGSGYFEIVSASRRLAHDIAFVARSLGFGVSIAYKAEAPAWRLSLFGEISQIPVRLERKKATRRRQKKDVLRSGFSVEFVGCHEWFGFELGGSDGLYLLGDFTVQHNTACAIAMVKSAMEKGSSCEFICDRQTLVRQTSQRFFEAGVPHGILMGDHSVRVHEPIRVSSAQTIQSRGFVPRDFVIIDECHEHRPGLLEAIVESGAILVGMTATPFPAVLAESYEGIVSPISTRALIGQGWLCPFDVAAPVAAVEVDGLRPKAAGEWAAQDVSARVLRIVGDVVPEWERHIRERFGGEPQPTVAFCASIDDTEAVAAEFRAAGYDCRAVSSREITDDNRDTLAAFERGDFPVIASCAMLSRGWDAPKTRILIDVYPLRRSLLTLIQRYGRIMRTAEGKERALVIDHAENWLYWRDEVLAFYQYGVQELGGERWAKAKRKKKADAHSVCRACRQVLAREDAACPNCGAERPKRPAGTGRKVQVVKGRLEIVDEVTGEVEGAFEGDVWPHICSHALIACRGDAERAAKRAQASHKSIFGRYTRREFVTVTDPDPAIGDLMRRNFQAWIVAKQARERKQAAGG